MKLIKIDTDHYIIVDDSEIKIGDWTHNISSKTIFIATNSLINLINCPNVVLTTNKKITHSTQPLGDNKDTQYFPNQPYYQKNGRLSLQEVKELIGEVEPLKNMWYERNVQNPYPTTTTSYTGFNKGFELGYNQALEDNKDKKYTEEDLKYMFECGRNYQNNAEITFKVSMEYLQPKTEWEVEFFDGKLKIK
jgi:hypothetical protein